ncbi:hypothetical protein IV203_014112 [Nitzschia inconspicua]|uniref:Uncharacterized protein n=1 Tax=Nitzschia inconspicua TaxID=303405 RepID=A0A9K3K6N6_9STRA|nr:hypothetical protein IV203_014300 [Nitzschia inconspicua]KAG7375017.1 hypothetical protein IV203_014112 [Nitzschia inconspicua]
MRLSFTKKRATSSAKKDILLFYKGPAPDNDDRTVTESCSVDGNNSSYSLSSSSTATRRSNEKQANKNKIMKYKASSSSLMKKFLCFSDQQAKHHRQIEQVLEEEEEEPQYTNDHPTNKTSLSTTAPTSTIIEYRPTCLDRRQDDDDEYCIEGYRYLQHASKTITTTSQQRGLGLEEPKVHREESSQLSNIDSVVQLQSRDRSTATPTTCSSSVSKNSLDVVTDDVAYNNNNDDDDDDDEQAIIGVSKDILPNLKDSPPLPSQPKRKESCIPILQLVDAKTCRFIPSGTQVQNEEREEPNSNSVTDEISKNLVVQPTWTVEDQDNNDLMNDTELVEDPDLIRHRSISMERNTTKSVQSLVPTIESMFQKMKSHQDTKQAGPCLQKNSLSMSSQAAVTTSQQASTLKQEPKTLASDAQDDDKEDDVERNIVDPNPANSDTFHIPTTEVVPTDTVDRLDMTQVNTTGTTDSQRMGESPSVSFVAIDLPLHNHRLDNVRNEIAWQRCMARKGARWFRNNKLRYNKPSLKNRHEVVNNTPIQAASSVTAIVDEVEEVPLTTLETVEKSSSFPSTMKRDHRTTIPLGICGGRHKADNDDDDSSVPIPADTRLVRTRSPVPIFPRRSMNDYYDYFFSSQEKEEENCARSKEDSQKSESKQENGDGDDAATADYNDDDNANDDVDNDSWLVNSSFGEDGTLVDSYCTRSDGEDDDDDDEVDALRVLDALVDMTMKDDLLYQAQQLGHSLSQLFESASMPSK